MVDLVVVSAGQRAEGLRRLVMNWSPDIRRSFVRRLIASIVFAYLLRRQQRDERFSQSVFAVAPGAARTWHSPPPVPQRLRIRTFSDEQLSAYLAAGLTRYPTAIQRLLRTMREPFSTSRKVLNQNISAMLALSDQMPFIASLGPEERYKARHRLVRDFCDVIAECVRSDSGIEDPTQI